MSEWIRVKDELPMREDRLLYLNDGVEFPGCVVGYWNRITKSWIINGSPVEDMPVTHWQPLPAPPEKP